jgi:hypothetical protein
VDGDIICYSVRRCRLMIELMKPTLKAPGSWNRALET